MRYEPDEHSSHEYEVKNVYTQGTSFKAVVFYLLAGQEVEISLYDVLKKTNLWLEPTESEPSGSTMCSSKWTPGKPKARWIST